MKKTLITLFCAITLNANAQWSSTQTKADELTGRVSQKELTYKAPSGYFLLRPDEYQFMIQTLDGIFDVVRSNGHTGQEILVGLYDADDTMIEKIKIWLDAPRGDYDVLITRNAGTMNNPIGQKGKVKKIIKHLNTDGHVRIVASRYGKSDFDLTIPHLPE